MLSAPQSKAGDSPPCQCGFRKEGKVPAEPRAPVGPLPSATSTRRGSSHQARYRRGAETPMAFKPPNATGLCFRCRVCLGVGELRTVQWRSQNWSLLVCSTRSGRHRERMIKTLGKSHFQHGRATNPLPPKQRLCWTNCPGHLSAPKTELCLRGFKLGAGAGGLAGPGALFPQAVASREAGRAVGGTLAGVYQGLQEVDQPRGLNKTPQLLSPRGHAHVWRPEGP